MNASDYEQELAQTNGVKIKHWVQPQERADQRQGKAVGLKCEYMHEARASCCRPARASRSRPTWCSRPSARPPSMPTGGALALSGGRIKVDAEGRTSVTGVWAGGDCVAGGQDLTVAAVDDGRGPLNPSTPSC